MMFLRRFKFPSNFSYTNYLGYQKQFYMSSKLSTLVNFQQTTRVARRTEQGDQYSFTMDTPNKRISFKCSEDITLEEFKNLFIKECEMKAKPDSIKVYSIDLAELSNVTTLADLENYDYYVVTDDKQVYKVDHVDLKPSEVAHNNYAETLDYFEKLGLPFIERKILLNYLERVDHLVKEELGKKLFIDHNPFKETFNKTILIENMIEALVNNKNIQTENEHLILREYLKYKDKLEDAKYQHDILEAKAHKNVKLKMSLGLLALIGQFSFVSVGTYMIYSWDIIEPMVYFITLGASIGLSAQFFHTFKDFSSQGLYEHLKAKELKKLYARNGFQEEEFIKLQENVKKLETKLKSNILINLQYRAP